ncbi:hypothetical protein DHC50_04275 [Arenibacter sp. A80]|nr:hypothetical protein [Arenibacter sp. A80]RFT56855.1 restriction endonuclease subunit S [Arenibacter sp. P308M17]
MLLMIILQKTMKNYHFKETQSLPHNWKSYKLSELTSVITKGTTPSTYGFDFLASGINYIRAQSLNYSGSIDEESFSYISQEAHDRLKRSQLKKNDILFSMAGAYLGMVGMIKESHCPANTNQAVGIIRISVDFVDVKFVEYTLRNPSTVEFVNSQSGQSAQPNINLAEIGNLSFKFPPLQEQKAIASILSALDDKIENNLAMNKTLEDMAMALYKHWFVDFGPFADGEFVDSELGMIPKGWEVKQLKEILEIKYGKDHKKLEEGTIPVYGTGGIMRYVNQSLYDQESILIPRKGSLNNLYYLNRKFWTVDTLFYSKIKLTGFGKYAFHFLKTLDLASMDVGSAIPSLTTQLLNRINVVIPPNHEVLKYDKIVTIWFNMIQSNIEENQTLTEIRDTMLSKLISGEVRLKEFKETLANAL